MLSAENRAMNIVARYGGDEFVSALSQTGIEGVRRFGIKFFYGDAGRLDLLHTARLLVLAIDDHEKANEIGRCQ